MQNFQNYYDLRQSGYDPNIRGRFLLRNIRSTLKEYMGRIAQQGNQGTWAALGTNIQELYSLLSSPHDLDTLSKELEKSVNNFNQMQGDHRMQEGIKSSVIHMVNELRNYITKAN